MLLAGLRCPTNCKACIGATVEKRQPGWLQHELAGGGVEGAKLVGEGIHGLGLGEGLIIEAIVELGDGYQRDRQEKPPIEVFGYG